ncbi:hypothetical protein C5C66_08475 [Rathayibacter toxicus]|nr:hypothetical protein TI83_08620 [Rathayibacter toxicus]PPG20533.1 hypothetical protein C5D15_08470 [Rathayibacter toxicus]PPG45635.1 hypothetical protein C5D16_08440 [Rathayibacter toxicus]PPH62218.1 hypothetical protein C5D13_08535 [Rathayibacter toxicus]PPH66828.1 hypothetical protein C5D01_08520 [Rathayibacter toxicus]
MAFRSLIERRKEEYAQVLEMCSTFFVVMKKTEVSERFTIHARMVRKANSLREVRKICTEV